jgi:hypothetical protein
MIVFSLGAYISIHVKQKKDFITSGGVWALGTKSFFQQGLSASKSKCKALKKNPLA